jgi:hypothetical protein
MVHLFFNPAKEFPAALTLNRKSVDHWAVGRVGPK